MHPPRLKEVVGLLGDQDAALDDAVQQFRSGFWPSRLSRVRDQLADAADLALSACLELRKAAMSSGGQSVPLRGMGYYTMAVEALYPLYEYVPAINRWFISPAQQDDELVIEALQQPPLPGTGILDSRNGINTRGGYSVYIPEYLTPETPVPVVVALHGGSGHGSAFLWTWVREARSRGLIVIAPTSTGGTWNFAYPGERHRSHQKSAGADPLPVERPARPDAADRDQRRRHLHAAERADGGLAVHSPGADRGQFRSCPAGDRRRVPLRTACPST